MAQDPAEQSVTSQINQIRNQLRSATGDQKKELRTALTTAVGKLFDLRHAAQAKQVEKLEEELAEAKELHKKRGERKGEIVDRRIAELLQAPDDLAWNRNIVGQLNGAQNIASAPAGSTQPYNIASPLLQGDQNPISTVPLFESHSTYAPGQPALSVSPQSNAGSTQLLNPMLSPSTTQNPSPGSFGSVPSENSIIRPSVVEISQPEARVSTLLQFLKSENQLALQPFFTEKAREQMAKAGYTLTLQIPPTASLVVDRAKYQDVEKKSAAVAARWWMPSGDEREVTFLLRLVDELWYVTGMMFNIDEKLVAINFEDASSMQSHLNSPSPNFAVPYESWSTKLGGAKADALSSETFSRIVETAYAYEEALEGAIESSSLYLKGMAPKQSYSAAQRNVAKTRALWEGIHRDLNKRMDLLQKNLMRQAEIIVDVQLLVEEGKLTADKLRAAQHEKSVLQAELEAFAGELEWMTAFEQKSILDLKRKFEEQENPGKDEGPEPNLNGEEGDKKE